MDKQDITLRALDTGEWEIFRDLRLHALKTEPAVFSSNFAHEATYGQPEWQGWLTPDGQYGPQCTFGLFDKTRLVGITGVFTAKIDPTGKTAVLGASYILPEYRGLGLSREFYRARLQWVADQPQMEKAVVSHRDTNEKSRRANQAFGFRHVRTDAGTWPDGTTGDELCYELDVESIRKVLSRAP